MSTVTPSYTNWRNIDGISMGYNFALGINATTDLTQGGDEALMGLKLL